MGAHAGDRRQYELQEHLGEMRQLIEEVIDANRTLTVELSPPVLRAERLDEAFEWLVAHMAELYELQVDLEMSGECRVPGDDKRELIFQLVRELLFNVVKHAGVNRARLYVEGDETQIVVAVEDQGTGFEVAPKLEGLDASAGLGLQNVKERLDLFDGELRIESGPGQGTRVTLTLPIDGPALVS